MILLDKNGNPPKSFDKRLDAIEAALNDLIPAHNANTKVLGAILDWAAKLSPDTINTETNEDNDEETV